jgi:hypothetical protein
LDAAPPPPPAIVEPAFPRVAATDFYPRGSHESHLCESASHPDWLYLAIPPLLLAGAIALDTQVFKYDWASFGGGKDTNGSAAMRDVGPVLVGATWGIFLGSFYPSMPKCSMHFATTAPPEGQVRTDWPVALAFAMLAAATAPIVDYIAIGPVPDSWTDSERISRIAFSASLAFGAALIPYLVPPKTLRHARELYNLRASVSAQSSFVSYTLHF